MFSNTADKLLLVLFILTLALILFLYIANLRGTNINYLHTVLLTLIPGIGGGVGLYRMQQWGGYKSIVGKSLFFSSIGMLFWASGSLFWIFYNFILRVDAPYPSLADLGYGQVYFWWGIGIVMLANATSVKFDVNQSKEKIYFLCAPIVMAIVTFNFIFLQAHGGTLLYDNPLKVLVDVMYPLGDVVILTLVVLVSGSTFNYLGLRLRLPIVIFLLGLMFNYVADLYFSYTTTIGSYYVGSMTDLFFTIAIFTMSLGLSNLHPKLLKD